MDHHSAVRRGSRFAGLPCFASSLNAGLTSASDSGRLAPATISFSHADCNEWLAELERAPDFLSAKEAMRQAHERGLPQSRLIQRKAQRLLCLAEIDGLIPVQPLFVQPLGNQRPGIETIGLYQIIVRPQRFC